MSQTKKCSRCKKQKEHSKFHKSKADPQGLNHRCKECVKAVNKKRRTNPAKRKQDEAHAQTDAAKNKRRMRVKKLRATDRGKLKFKLERCLRDFKLGIDSPANRTLIGCTLREFRAHIESLMEPWMDWDSNYGANTGKYNTTWNFDHIVPYDAFKTYEELNSYQKTVCWFKNVRPLCAKKNRLEHNAWTQQGKDALIERYSKEHI